MKVLHVPDVDFRTTVPDFRRGPETNPRLVAGQPRHVPILILVELKDEADPGLPTRPVTFGHDELDAVDAEILSVFDSDGDPDARPGARPVRDPARGDPGRRLAGARRRPRPVMFALDNEGAVRDRYLEGHPAFKIA